MSEINRKITLVESGREVEDISLRINGQLSESLPTIRGTAGVGGKIIEPPEFVDFMHEDLTEEDVLEIF